MPAAKYRGRYADRPYNVDRPQYDYASNGRIRASVPLTTDQHKAVKDEAKAAGTTVGRYLAGIVVPQLKLKKKKENQ